MIITAFKAFLILILLSYPFQVLAGGVHNHHYNLNSTGSGLTGIEFPDHPSFNAVSSSSGTGCMKSTQSESLVQPTTTTTTTQKMPPENDNDDDDDDEDDKPRKQAAVKFHLKRRSTSQDTGAKESVVESTIRDLSRIQTLQIRITEKKNQNKDSRLLEMGSSSSSSSSRRSRHLLAHHHHHHHSKKKKKAVAVPPSLPPESEISGHLMATLESGVSLGSGEYFMDVYVGTPPKHFSLILDTGSDLNWIQCVPCHDCFEQNGPHYDPNHSSSYENIGCHDSRCRLVSSPDPPQPCKEADNNQTCPYFYWYGDSSNTTGDFALETFTVNLTTTTTGKSEFRKVENVMFGCGHWNRGLFHGAAGLLGLGRGPLSFSSQLQSLHGHSFSYCLVDRNSDASVSSKLIFGEDKELLSSPNLNFTSFVAGKENQVDTFYYVGIKSILVGGEVLHIPEETWNLTSAGAGGTIIDSGTTLSYFADPAYKIIKEAFVKKVKGYPMVTDFPILSPCYNVSGLESFELPEFAIQFSDGAVWNFPVENYFIRIEPEGVVCLAILGTPRSSLSIIGNYQQQNFHILYDTNKSRLGFTPARCADV